MATRSPSQSAAARKPAKKTRTRAKVAPKSTAGAAAGANPFAMPDMSKFGAGFPDMSKMPNVMTTEQAIDLYKSNAKMALDMVNAAIDNTAKLRKLQFEGEEQARAMHKKAARSAAEAGDAQSLMAAGQNVAQEAIEQSMRYWSDMFELIVEMQKRIFTLIESQTAAMPGANQAKAAMSLMPDLTQMQKVVSAMQNVVTSGGPAFESMQRVMSDFARMTGIKR
jgi:Phasin protein